MVTGEKSRTGSNGIFAIKLMLIVRLPACPISNV
jgi:hypothetical protein